MQEIHVINMIFLYIIFSQNKKKISSKISMSEIIYRKVTTFEPKQFLQH